jgi:hypothetical protein
MFVFDLVYAYSLANGGEKSSSSMLLMVKYSQNEATDSGVGDL